MSFALKKRFAIARELRAYADEVEALELASHRDPARPIEAKIDLVQRMPNRATEVMNHEDPAERGEFRASEVFAERPGWPARPVRVAVARARIGGKIRLAKAA